MVNENWGAGAGPRRRHGRQALWLCCDNDCKDAGPGLAWTGAAHPGTGHLEPHPELSACAETGDEGGTKVKVRVRGGVRRGKGRDGGDSGGGGDAKDRGTGASTSPGTVLLVGPPAHLLCWPKKDHRPDCFPRQLRSG